MTQDEAEAIAKAHVELAQSVVRWFGFDRRREVQWAPPGQPQHYNQAARDIYVKACRLIGVEPIPAE